VTKAYLKKVARVRTNTMEHLATGGYTGDNELQQGIGACLALAEVSEWDYSIVTEEDK
jgi:hypothetical protein